MIISLENQGQNFIVDLCKIKAQTNTRVEFENIN